MVFRSSATAKGSPRAPMISSPDSSACLRTEDPAPFRMDPRVRRLRTGRLANFIETLRLMYWRLAGLGREKGRRDDDLA